MFNRLTTSRARAKRWSSVAALVVASLGASAVVSLPAFAQQRSGRPAGGDSTTTTARPGLTERSSGTSGPGPRSRNGRVEGLTQDLALRGARIVEVNLDDTQDEYAVFEFADFVRDINNKGGFSLQGPSVASNVSASTADIVEGSPNQVLVGFPSGTDMRSYTIATVETDTVRDEVGQGNVPATVRLQGAVASGRTAGPELLGTTLNETLDRVTYRFDEEIEEKGSANASGFGFYTLDGKVVLGNRIVTIDDELVTVEFDDQVEDGVRYFVKSGAAKDRQGIENTPGSVGRATTSPDLVSVTRAAGETQLDFTFDETVTDPKPGAFLVYTDAGKRFRATGWTRVDESTVRLIFPDIDDHPNDVRLAAVDPDAVKANDLSAVANTVGAVSVGAQGANATGVTSGPDLLSAQPDRRTGQVRYTFDEAVNDEVKVDPARFYVITQAGDLVQGKYFVEVEGNSVVITFDTNVVEAATGYVVDGGAVQDFGGDSNPAGSL